MPYKDPEKNRAYMREYRRNRRAQGRDKKAVKVKNGSTTGLTSKPCSPVQLFQLENSPFRIKTAGHIMDLLADTIGRVQSLPIIDTGEALQQCRVIGYLAGIALKAVETADIENRIEALEEILQKRAG